MSKKPDPLEVWKEVYRSLPVEDAAIVDLHYAHGLTQKQIAEKLERHQSYISRSLDKSLKKLKQSSVFQRISELATLLVALWVL